MDASKLAAAAERQGREHRGELRKLVIPEWSTPEEEAAIFHYQGLTVGEFQQIARYIDQQTAQIDLEVLVEAVILLARNEEGVRLFNSAMRREIKEKWASDTLVDIVNRMGVLSQLAIDPEEAIDEKK